MVTSAGKAHCTWCGAVITGGRRFCGACGQAVDEDADDDEPRTVYRPVPPQSQKLFKDALDVEQDQSPGMLGKLGRGLATAVGVPLAIVLGLISVVVSTALPILIILALIIGPVDTWNRIRAWVPEFGDETDNTACEGFNDWLNSSNERGNELYALIDPVQKRVVEDPTTLRRISTDIQAIITEQRQSDPPPEAEELNRLLVEIYGNFAEGIMAVANGDFTNMQSYDSEHRELASQADAEDKRVRQACL